MISDVLLAKCVFVLGNFWLFLGFLLLFSPPKTERYRLVILLSLLVLTASVIGLRKKNVGVDTPKYVAAFESAKPTKYHALELYEPGYVYGGIIFKKIFKEYNFYLAWVSFILALFALLGFRLLLPHNYPLAFTLYFSTFVFWLSNISMIRQGVAISLLFYTYALLEQRSRPKAAFWNILACLWHFSSFFFPLAYLFKNFYYYLYQQKRILFWVIYLIILGGVIYPGPLAKNLVSLVIKYAYQLSHNPFLEKMYFYLYWPKLKAWNIKHTYFLITGLFLLALPWAQKNVDVFKIYLFLLVGFTIIFLTKFDEMVADRMFMYFVPFIPVLILRLIPVIFPLKRDQQLAYLTIFLGALVWFNVKLYFLQYASWFINPVRAIR